MSSVDGSSPASTRTAPERRIVFTAASVAPASVKKSACIGSGGRLVRNHGICGAADLYSAHQSLVLRWAECSRFQEHGHVALQAIQLTERVDGYSSGSIQRAERDELGGPNLTVTASDFGKTNTQASGYYGRQVQYSARVESTRGTDESVPRRRLCAAWTNPSVPEFFPQPAMAPT